MFLEISQNSQENTCARISFFMVQVFQDPGLPGSRFFSVQIFQGQWLRVRVQVLEVAFILRNISHSLLSIVSLPIWIFVCLHSLEVNGICKCKLSFDFLWNTGTKFFTCFSSFLDFTNNVCGIIVRVTCEVGIRQRT